MFSADKKRVETALESCGLNFNRVCGQGQGVGGAGWGVSVGTHFLELAVLGSHPTFLALRVSPFALMSFPWKFLSGS